MTTCPRCGQPLRAPVAACPRCGLRFAPPAQPPQSAQNGYAGYDGYHGANGFDNTFDNGFDDATPAWMQQARPQPSPYAQAPLQPYAPAPQAPQQPPAYGQPAMPAPPNVRPGFSMNELVSEEALPDWLRQASADSAQPTQRQPVPGSPGYGAPPYPPASPPANPLANAPAYPVAYPPANAPAYGGYAAASAEEASFGRPDASAFPGIESAGSYQAPPGDGGGLSAGSLLDPNALPGWLSGQQGQAASASMRSGEGMRAQSLIDDAALPEWMRNEANGSTGNGNGAGIAGASALAQPALPPAVPAWGAAPAAAPVYPPSPAAPIAPMMPGAGAFPPAQLNGQQGFSARDLVDPNAMPSWAQPEQSGQPGLSQGADPARGAAAPGQWSASDLIDPAMLPGWVRENDGAAPQNGMASPAPPMPGSAYDAPRERTGRVPSPQNTRGAGNSARPSVSDREPTGQDFGASRAGPRGGASRKYPAARPLDDSEKPAWLLDGSDGYDEYGGYGQPGGSASPAGHPGRGPRSRNGYDDPDGQNGQPVRNGHNGHSGRNGMNGQTSHTARRRQAPRAQQPVDHSWAEPDGYDDSPWAARPTTARGARPDARPAAKKRKGGFFGFLRRG